jgi:hypothetical protein
VTNHKIIRNIQRHLILFKCRFSFNAIISKKSFPELEILDNLYELCKLFWAKAKKPKVLEINKSSSQDEKENRNISSC